MTRKMDDAWRNAISVGLKKANKIGAAMFSPVAMASKTVHDTGTDKKALRSMTPRNNKTPTRGKVFAVGIRG